MSNAIDREKFDYQPLGDDGGQYMTRELESKEKEVLFNKHFGEGGVDVFVQTAKVFKDNYSKKEFIVTGLVEEKDYMAYDDKNDLTGKFVAYEVAHDIGSIKLVSTDPAQTFKNLNIEPEFFEARELSSRDDSVKLFESRVAESLSDKKSVFSIALSVSDRQAELSEALDYTTDIAPDVRGELRGHGILSGLVRNSIHEDAEKIESLVSDKMALERAVNAGFVSAMSLDDIAINKSNDALENYREQMMHKSLMPSRVLVDGDKLLDASTAESFTNNKFAALKEGQVMSLGDVSSKWNIGKLDAEAASIINKQLEGYKSESELVSGVSLKQKGSDAITHVYISKDADDSLFVRAVTVSAATGEVRATNKESFDQLGISPASFEQGEVTVGNGPHKTATYRDTQAREDNMLAQISPNNLRHLISEAQIKEHYVNIAGIGVNDVEPSQRVAANIVEAVADDAFKITKLNKRQVSDLKMYAAFEDRNHKDNEDITSAFLIEKASGQKSIVGAIKSPSGTNAANVETFIEHFDQNARRIPDHSLKADAVAMGITLDSHDPDVDSVRVALQESRNFTSFAFDEQDGVPDRLAIPFGDERKPHPIVKAAADKETALASDNTAAPQEDMDNTSRVSARIRR